MLRTSIVLVFALAGCGGGNKQADPAPTPTTPTAPTKQAMTADECTAAGGEVVGDIGDGAIHRPDYKCPKSGQPPIGTIQTGEGQPMGVEGAVCCK